MSAAAGNLRDDEGDIEPELFEGSPPAAAHWNVQMTRLDLPIGHLHRRFLDHELILDTDLARDLSWDTGTKSRLVESVLVRIPLPAFYFFENADGRLTVIDGQQRLHTLFSFIENRLALKGLPLLWDLEGKRFEAIEARLQRRFLDTTLTCFVLPETSPEIVVETYRRLHAGKSPFSSQEVRNSLFRGPGLELVTRLAAATGPSSFRAVAGQRQAFPGMSADELVLRGLAFLDRGPAAYRGRMEAFLSEELRRLNQASPEELARLERRFHAALERTAVVFGDNAFHRYVPAEDRWVEKLNRSLVEVLIAGFDRHFPEEKTLTEATVLGILERFKRLCSDPAFVGAITGATLSRAKVEQRFSLWMKEMADVA